MCCHRLRERRKRQLFRFQRHDGEAAFVSIGSGYPPVIGQLPDLSEYRLNEEFGLGDPEHNKRLMKGLEEARPARIINNELKLWSPWKSLWKGGKGIRERVQEQEHDKRFLNVEEKKRS